MNPWIIKRETQWCFQVIVNLLGSSLVGGKEGEATLSTAYQTHQKSSPVCIACVLQIFSYADHKPNLTPAYWHPTHTLGLSCIGRPQEHWEAGCQGDFISNIIKFNMFKQILKRQTFSDIFQLGKYVEKMEFFHKAGPTVTKTQTGVVRSETFTGFQWAINLNFKQS